MQRFIATLVLFLFAVFARADDLSGIGIVEYTKQALIVDIGERRFEEHALVDGAIFGEIGDDVVDEGHLVSFEITYLQEVSKCLLNGFDIQSQYATDKLPEWLFSVFMDIIFLCAPFSSIKEYGFQLLQFPICDELIGR